MTASVSEQQRDCQPDHQLYEALCALAVTDQLSQKDRTALDAHCGQCFSCRERLLDLTFVNRELILHVTANAVEAPMPAGSLERFLARAKQEGIALRSAPKFSSVHNWVPALSVLVVFAVMLISMQHSRLAPTDNPIVANAIAPSDIDTQRLTYTRSSPTVLQSQVCTTLRAKHSIGVSLAPVAVASTASQQAILAPERFSQAIPSAYPFFESPPKLPQAVAYPALSRAQVLHLALFRNEQAQSTQPTLSIATVYRPDALFPADRSFDFAPRMRQFRFQLPTNQ
jgi:hypothetical protein